MNIAIIFAGGSGVRMGAGIPKQFLEINGKPILVHTLQLFQYHDQIDAIYISVLEDYIPYVEDLAEEYHLTFIPLQQDLDELSRTAPAQWWLADGVHPNMAFYQYMTDKWIAELRAGE